MALKKGKTKGVTDNIDPEAFKEVFIDKFKQIGKFKNGKATINNKPYTGVIHTDEQRLIYENGNLIKSVGINGEKIYEREGDKLTKITHFNNYAGDKRLKSVLNKNEDGSINIKRYDYDGKVVDYETTVKPDGMINETFYGYDSVIKDDKLVKKLAKSVTAEYNTKTGIGKIITNDLKENKVNEEIHGFKSFKNVHNILEYRRKMTI